MGFSFKGLLFVVALSGSALAQVDDSSHSRAKNKHYVIKDVKVSEVSVEVLDRGQYKDFDLDPVDPSKIIAIGKELVALGQDIYKLVIKGKPTNTTSYSPISVLPKVNGIVADMFDTEGWLPPVKRTYEAVFENVYGVEVVKFRYGVIYSYNGSLNGKGAYLDSVQIVPESVKTLFGFDFTATMKLGGIQNLGTKEDPIAGATILMEYTASSVMTAINKVDSYFVTGKGHFNKL